MSPRIDCDVLAAYVTGQCILATLDTRIDFELAWRRMQEAIRADAEPSEAEWSELAHTAITVRP